jgi:hypothetical protein
MRQQFVNQVAVELDASLVHFTAAARQQAGPGNRKAIALQTHFRHQRYVFAKTMVVVNGDVTGRPLIGGARKVGINIPDRRAFAVGIVTAFNLPGRGRGAP